MARARADVARDAPRARRRTCVGHIAVAISSCRADARGRPRAPLRAVLRASRRGRGRGAPHAARDACLRRVGAARVRHAGRLVAAGAARDRAHGRARRCVSFLSFNPDGAAREVAAREVGGLKPTLYDLCDAIGWASAHRLSYGSNPLVKIESAATGVSTKLCTLSSASRPVPTMTPPVLIATALAKRTNPVVSSTTVKRS